MFSVGHPYCCYCWRWLLLLLLLLRALATVVLCRFRANMKSGLSKMSPNRSKSSQFCNVGHKTSRMMNFANKTACRQAPTPSRGDLTHKSAVMYNQIRATRLNVKGKSLALAYCCWRSLLLFYVVIVNNNNNKLALTLQCSN